MLATAAHTHRATCCGLQLSPRRSSTGDGRGKHHGVEQLSDEARLMGLRHIGALLQYGRSGVLAPNSGRSNGRCLGKHVGG